MALEGAMRKPFNQSANKAEVVLSGPLAACTVDILLAPITPRASLHFFDIPASLDHKHSLLNFPIRIIGLAAVQISA
jgi:hypothetical protein